MVLNKKYQILSVVTLINVGAAIYTFFNAQNNGLNAAPYNDSDVLNRTSNLGLNKAGPDVHTGLGTARRPGAALYKNFPNITYYVRTSSVPYLKTWFYCILLRTTVFFWPAAYGKMVLVLDEESTEDHAFADLFQRQVKENLSEWKLQILFESLPPGFTVEDLQKLPRGVGYSRQLWNNFFLDKFTRDEIISYMDVDAQLKAPITKEFIFGRDINRKKLWVTGIKPVIPQDFRILSSWVASTEKALGLKVIGCFMTTFPQLLHRTTIINTRHYLLRKFNTTDFSHVFKQITGPGILLSPINIIMNYAWYYERNRYNWHLNIFSKDVEDINKMVLDQHKIRLEDTKPSIMPVAHMAVTKQFQPQLFTPGYCETLRAMRHPSKGCDKIGHDYNTFCEMFIIHPRFHVHWQNYMSHWCKEANEWACCGQTVREHYADVAKIPPEVHTFNVTKVLLVERLARETGVTCSALPFH